MFILLILLLSTLAISSTSKSLQGDLDILKNRIVQCFLWDVSDILSLSKSVSQYMQTLQVDGSWADIDYSDQGHAVWKTATHINRVNSMIHAYLLTGPLFHNTELKTKVLLALDYWLVKDFKNPNWWWNKIGIPLQIGEISLLGELMLLNNQTKKCEDIMYRANWAGYTGENTVWMAVVHIYNGCLQGNNTYVTEAFNKIYDTVVITPGEDDGIKQDAAFFQHGPQLYSGGYGSGFTSDLINFIFLSVNTLFSIPKQALDILSHLVLDGQQWMTTDRYFDINCKGREITRVGSLKNGFNTTYLKMVPGPRHQEWVDFATRLDTGKPTLSGNRMYWKADFMAHKRSNYSVSVKSFSKRTYNSECVNEEGKKSLHLADGANYIYLTGDEYINIFPVWDWYKIPGTTVEQEGQPLICENVKTLGTTTFVGGVSDNVYGILAYDYKDSFKGTTQAKKAWFFFDEEFVALGTDISCQTQNPVVTTLNQCLLRGNVITSNSPNPLAQGQHTFNDVWWVHHDNIGYAFNQKAPPQLIVSNDVQWGSWSEIGAGSSTNISENVFKIYVDHPNPPVSGGSYQYIVAPDLDVTTFSKRVQSYETQILVLENSANLQAIFHSGLNVFGVIFWTPGKVSGPSNEWNLSADKPCTVLVVQRQNTITISVANPQQDMANNNVIITISRPLSGTGCNVTGNITTFVFSLKTDEFAGSTMSQACNI